MAVAAAYFKNEGYAVKDVSRNESFDLLGTRGDEALTIEVKGTTSTASAILLTKNEVELHKRVHPHNALAVVHSITLDKSGTTPRASDGKLAVTQPWLIDDSLLTALSFAYALYD